MSAGKIGPVPPLPNRLVADVDAPLEQQVFDVPQGQREPHVHQHRQPDHLRRGVEAFERAGGFCSGLAGHHAPLAPASFV